MVVVLYAAAVLWVGWRYARRQESEEEYFLGNRSMSPFLIGISLFASLLSTVSYLAYPGEIIQHGPAYLTGILSVPFAYFIVGYWLIPVYMRQRVTSAYELLEERLGREARVGGAILFVVLRLIWMALLIYLSSGAIRVMTGLSEDWVPVISILTGLVAVAYTSMGGLRAVVITDLMQFVLLFLGLVVSIVVVSISLEGFSWIPMHWSANWDTQPVFSLDPEVRATVVGAIVLQLVFRVCTAGADQTMVQRFMATTNARAARKSFLVQSLAAVVVTLSLGLLGFALLGYFRDSALLANPELDLGANADNLFPYFIAHALPTGLSGLVVAALFAAGMSSVDSGVNSITAVLNRDLLPRFCRKPGDTSRRKRRNRRIAWSIGMLVILLSVGVRYVPGNYLEVTQKTSSLFFPPLFSLFFLALFVRRANGRGALVGVAYGMAAAILVAFWDVLTGRPPLSYQWIGFTSLVTSIGAGWLACVFFDGRRSDRKRAFYLAAMLFGLVALFCIVVFAMRLS